MYIPGYSLSHNQHQPHSILHPQPSYSLSQTSLIRARSTSPTNQPAGGGSTNPDGSSSAVHHLQQQPFQRAALGGGSSNNGLLYADLQFPVASNYGSMKKRSQRSAANTASTTVLSSAGEPSPSSGGEDSHNSTLPISQSVDNVARGYHEYVNRKTAV